MDSRHQPLLRPHRHVEFNGADGPRTIDEFIKRAGLRAPMPVIVILGGAAQMDDAVKDDIRTVFERSLAPVLDGAGVAVITGGTNSGVMAIAGETLQSVATLIGVTPRGAVEGEGSSGIATSHHWSVLTAGEKWGSETDYMVRLAMRLTNGSRRGVVLLANGGPVAVEEVNSFIEAGWPILTLSGSGRAANSLSRQVSLLRRFGLLGEFWIRRFKPGWSIAGGSDIEVIRTGDSPLRIKRHLNWYIAGDELLKEAYSLYANFDRQAAKQRQGTRWALVVAQLATLAVLTVILVGIQTRVSTNGVDASLAWIGSRTAVKNWTSIAVPVAIVLPIAIAVTTAVSQSLAADKRWRVFRGVAQLLEREIYRYRATVACLECPAQLGDARSKLKDAIDLALDRSASMGFLLLVDLSSRRGRPSALATGTDEMARLTLASYLSHRIDQQIAYFHGAGRRLRITGVALIVVGAILAASSGLLASSYLAPLAALAIFGFTALATVLERSRVTDRAARYATAAAELSQAKSNALLRPATRHDQDEVLLRVVHDAEWALEKESFAWEQLVWQAVKEPQHEKRRSFD